MAYCDLIVHEKINNVLAFQMLASTVKILEEYYPIFKNSMIEISYPGIIIDAGIDDVVIVFDMKANNGFWDISIDPQIQDLIREGDGVYSPKLLQPNLVFTPSYP